MEHEEVIEIPEVVAPVEETTVEPTVEEFLLDDKWIENSPIEEVFGIKFAEGIDTWTLVIVACAVLFAYGIKRAIDFFFEYQLEKSKKSD